jgi:hypothetical protein
MLKYLHSIIRIYMKDITLVSSNPSITHKKNRVVQVRLETTATKEFQARVSYLYS